MEEMLIMCKDHKRRLHYKISCQNCKIEFWQDKRDFIRNKNNFCSFKCFYKWKSDNSTVLVTCAYCDKEFTMSRSKQKISKSGLNFCSRKHKDLAQRLNGIKEIHPNHYSKDGIYHSYRRTAYENYDARCINCKNDDRDVLEVHHIDGDRSNNKLDNLIILCSNCHTKITKGKAIIKNREYVLLGL